MRIYVGQTRSRDLIERLLMAGWGEMTCRGELPPRRTPWAYDNGAFTDWRRDRPFGVEAFERDLDAISALTHRPDFIVVPDVVAGGLKSLQFSLAWTPRLEGLAPRYLAVQDGMSVEDVRTALEEFEGVFVGGTLPWKLRTGADWVILAHELGLRCHIGRVGTFRRVQWARRIEADSIDSCLPLWSEDNLGRFVEGLSRAHQADLFHEPMANWAPPPQFWRGMGVAP